MSKKRPHLHEKWRKREKTGENGRRPELIKKTCKNLLTKVILLAIIIKLSREPSPRRQPLEPLPTACTPFFEENFFKKLSENLLTNERI